MTDITTSTPLSTRHGTPEIRREKPRVTGSVHVDHYNGEILLRADRRGRLDPHLVCWSRLAKQHGESYFGLRLAMENLHKGEQGLVVAVTSPARKEGKTLTAMNLAGSLALDAQTKVLLVDLDLRSARSGVCDYLGLPQKFRPGIIDAIENENLRLEEVTHYLPEFNLYLLANGGKVAAPYEFLKSDRLDEIIEQARQRYDYVVIDATQILKLPDTQLVSRCVDGFVVVIRADATRRDMLAESLDSMNPEKVLGLVFNSSTMPGV